MPTSLWAVVRRCDACFARYSVAVAPYKSCHPHQRRSKATYAKDCPLDGLFAFFSIFRVKNMLFSERLTFRVHINISKSVFSL